MGIIAPKIFRSASRAFVALVLLILSPLLIFLILLNWLWGTILYISIWLTQRKPFVVFVYSDSPIWKDYIKREILPHVQDRAAILNWSERRHWKNSLAVLAFRYFGGYRNFNPLGMVFQPFRVVKTYRFFEAYKEFKHGDPQKVEELKERLLADIRSGPPVGK
jgi:hypothetical protein